ncbi:hypothetical protein FDECE_5459 [Fusarium decemcellulare]|nr:hypothetical protein FDECE_5459 [Fusarium decemcellulare]
MTDYQRRRSVLACDVCRSRRTKCDARKPKCGFCVSHNAECVYRTAPEPQPSRLEVDIAEIRQRLDQMTTLLTSYHRTNSSSGDDQTAQNVVPSPRVTGETPETNTGSFASSHGIAVADSDFPIMTIQRKSMMRVLDLDPETATWLVNMERRATVYPYLAGHSLNSSTPRLFMLQSHRVTAALAGFSEHVHAWYPLFSADFSETFFDSVNDANSSPVNSCLVVLVIAIGCVAERNNITVAFGERSELAYINEAISFLPHVFLEHSIAALQCFILFAIYHLQLLQPCQAHDYILAASSRAQNLLRSGRHPPDSDAGELLCRAYWSILLIESELIVQLDLPQSGIWAYDESISLPSASTIWHLPPQLGEVDTVTPQSSSGTPSLPGSTLADPTIVYFLSEIAMRRMLQRCTSSVSKSAGGRLRYAPVIATELELQLHEWYDCLPPLLRFPKNFDDSNPINTLSPNAQFLQAQFFACKASIYWPAVYQSIEFGEASEELSQYCAKYFQAYVSFVSVAAPSVKNCRVNAWTLVASSVTQIPYE